MAKKQNLCKKPLLIASICMIVAFATALILLAVVPYAVTPYTYVDENGNKYEYVFRRDVYEYSINDDDEPSKTAYILEDGVVKTGTIKVKVGEIDAYTFTAAVSGTVYTNTFSKVLMIVSIVGASLGGVGVVLYFVLNNKGSKTKSTKKSSKKK